MVEVPAPALSSPSPSSRPELRPVTGDTFSLRVTLDLATKAELDTLAALLSHVAGRDLAAVLREAIRCGIEKHGKRRGAVRPEKGRARASSPATRTPGDKVPAAEGPEASACGASKTADGALAAAAPMDPRAVPVEVRRQVWERDGGRCAYVAPDGRRCGSQWKLELHHVDPAALGGPPTVENTSLRCRPHNLLEAERVFGREHMASFSGESAIAGDSCRA